MNLGTVFTCASVQLRSYTKVDDLHIARKMAKSIQKLEIVDTFFQVDLSVPTCMNCRNFAKTLIVDLLWLCAHK